MKPKCTARSKKLSVHSVLHKNHILLTTSWIPTATSMQPINFSWARRSARNSTRRWEKGRTRNSLSNRERREKAWSKFFLELLIIYIFKQTKKSVTLFIFQIVDCYTNQSYNIWLRSNSSKFLLFDYCAISFEDIFEAVWNHHWINVFPHFAIFLTKFSIFTFISVKQWVINNRGEYPKDKRNFSVK